MAERCLLVQPIHPRGVARLRDGGLEPVLAAAPTMAAVAAEIGPVIAVVTRNAGLSAEALARATRLKAIGVHGVGTDAVAVEEATRRGIPVINTPGANARSVAEYALGLTFALSKALVAGDTAVRQGDPTFKYRVVLSELQGRAFGIVGFGTIGQATAKLASAMGFQVLVWSRGTAACRSAAEDCIFVPSLDALLEASDVVSLHVPLTDATRDLLGTRELALMRSHALLINTARGGLVDEVALVAALEAGRLGGAALDVFSTEPLPTTAALCMLPNVVLSPHMAGSTAEALERTALMVADGILAILSGRRPPTLVNAKVWPP